MSDGFYRFPAMAKAGEWTNEEQVVKVREKSTEACNAFWVYEITVQSKKADHERRTRYGMKLMSLLHCVETALRMEFGDDEVAEFQQATEEKNRKRGYYWEETE